MPNVVGPRGNFAVVVPSTNTVVEAEYNWMRPEGVSFHAGRILVDQPGLDSDEVFERFLAELRTRIGTAIDSVMTCKPDHMIMGMSAETFWGGAEGNDRFEAWVREVSGLGVSTGASACHQALQAFGAARIGVITPYQAVADEQVRRFFTESGYEVLAVEGLRCPSATAIAEVPATAVTEAFATVNVDGAEALVQVGTNLPAVKVAAELELRLAKPVIAINAATLWHALRANGIGDKMSGYGRLLAEL